MAQKGSPSHPRNDVTSQEENAGTQLQAAKRKTGGYLDDDKVDNSASDRAGPSRTRSEDEWDDIVGQRIEEAMRQGAFDNLPGRGKPLNLARNPFVPEEREIANKLLQNNDLAPAWIGERTDLLTRIAEFRSAMQSAVERYPEEASPSATQEQTQRWRNRVDDWQAEIEALNRKILAYNIQQPVAHLELFPLLLDDELHKLGASRAAMS